MSLSNSHDRAVAITSMKALMLGGGAVSPTNRAIALTHLMGHGGIYTLFDTQVMLARLSAISAGERRTGDNPTQEADEVAGLVAAMQDRITSYFSSLVADPYPISSNLERNPIILYRPDNRRI